ncbi:MAG: 30S ribosome-binding factor RbfA [Betaproteobacteria bacterium]|nr:MAG: 30S ribosome-binding factor RbfA [Betaproteobacteria bacterium]
MPKDYCRTMRIADQIQRELADLIRNELKDRRVGMITLTDVEVSQDYAHAKIFYTTLGNEEDDFLTDKGLKHATGFLRSQLSHRLTLRTVPQLHFIYDESVERGIHLSQLIDKAVE